MISISTILIVILILMLLSAYLGPAETGYGPSGGLGLVALNKDREYEPATSHYQMVHAHRIGGPCARRLD